MEDWQGTGDHKVGTLIKAKLLKHSFKLLEVNYLWKVRLAMLSSSFDKLPSIYFDLKSSVEFSILSLHLHLIDASSTFKGSNIYYKNAKISFYYVLFMIEQ